VPPPGPARQTVVTGQRGERGMPLVWGVYPWKDLVLASDINSGLWVFRVRLDRDPASGSGAAAPPAAPAPAARATPAAPAQAGGPDLLARLSLVGLALGLLAVALVALTARRRAG
jgi:hypothetical protein